MKKQKKSRVKLLHQYYKYTGFYRFVLDSLKKAALPLAGIVLVLFLLNEYVLSIDDGLEFVSTQLSVTGVFITFFVSESFLGLIPPEIFIGWSKKTSDPVLNLSLLALLSYIGGIISYYIGKRAALVKSVKNYMEEKMAKHLKNTSKWGGFLIIVGALFPIPFSITCMAAGMIKYPVKGVFIFGLFRFARFAVYGWAIFNVVS